MHAVFISLIRKKKKENSQTNPKTEIKSLSQMYSPYIPFLCGISVCLTPVSMMSYPFR